MLYEPIVSEIHFILLSHLVLLISLLGGLSEVSLSGDLLMIISYNQVIP